jgi:hypothetical protein
MQYHPVGAGVIKVVVNLWNLNGSSYLGTLILLTVVLYYIIELELLVLLAGPLKMAEI